MPASQDWDHLLAPLEQLLRSHPDGLSEFELIRALGRDASRPEFAPHHLRDPLGLFRVHFVLFHCLYRLQDRLSAGRETVAVHCLCCRILPHPDAAAAALHDHDPLAAFYREPANIDAVSAAGAARLIGAFWRRMQGYRKREHALAVLGLADPVGDAEIKSAYRRLAMRHHPDRGGDTAALQRLNEALAALC